MLQPHVAIAGRRVLDGAEQLRRRPMGPSLDALRDLGAAVEELGEPGHNLFHERTNLRYGCTILRHYLDRERGNLSNALARYNGSLGRPNYSDLVIDRLVSRWRYQH